MDNEIIRLAAAHADRRFGAARHARGWSELPTDILLQVIRRLPIMQVRHDLATVCRHWRAAVRLRLPLPKLCLAVPSGQFLTFQGYPVFKSHINDPNLRSYRGATDTQLLFDDCGVYKLVNLFNERERLLPVPYAINIHDEEIVPAEGYWSDEMPVRKLVVCPDSGLVAAIIGHERSARAALCMLEAAWSWSLSTRDPWRWYADMAFVNGKLYALTNDEDLFALEVGYDGTSGEPRISSFERAIAGCSGSHALHEYTRMRYLVSRPHNGGLLMVCRIMLDDYGSTTHGFAVFEADMSSSRWVQVNTLGSNEALFVGRLCSRAVRADQHQVHADHIFFLDDSTGMESLRHPLREALANVYDMNDGSISKVSPIRQRRRGGEEVPLTWIFREDEDKDAEG